MITVTKEFLSSSTNGRGIKVVATTTPGTTVHTCPAGVATKDEVYLYIYNDHTSAVLVTVEWGGTTVPDDIFRKTIPSKDGLWLVNPGLCLNNGLVVSVFAATPNVCTVTGIVHRITN